MAAEVSNPEVLEKERLFFEAHRREWLENHENLFVLVKGEHLVGVFADPESAYNEGLNRFGLEPFLVKQVVREEPVSSVTIFSVTPPVPVYNHYWIDGQGRVGSPESILNLARQGPTIPVLVSVTQQHAQALQKRPVPQPVSGYASLDTGAFFCGIDFQVIRGFGMPPFGYCMTQGATNPRPIPTPTFPASLSFPNTPLPNITFQDFVGLPLSSQGIIAIIGRTVLRSFVMTYNGPAAMVTLSY